MGIEYITAVVIDGGIQIDQLFFHDSDGYMIEICDCQKLPVLPLTTQPLNKPSHAAPIKQKKLRSVVSATSICSAVETDWMMENLICDIVDIAF
ncbi:hypothetical protein QJS10_CPB11g00888 [Acorus calamus]|uniref:Uncharacterized protein n=1 Tax=Acorus calamus TaxID=4465 RepID=A0AAV9DSJ3_ACOCL|nr:hypothetical protein QJS10_CPB11g00888 [Acorus calamus]